MTTFAILADARAEAGLGHVARCYALTEALEADEIRAEFLVRSSDGARSWLESRGVHVRIVENVIEECVSAIEYDAVVLDGYCYSCDDVVRLERARPVCMIEDHPHDWPARAILNPNLHARRLYDGTSRSRLVGPEHALVRREIRDRRPVTRHAALSATPHVLVTTGGIDPPNGAARTVRALAMVPHELEVRIAVSPEVATRPELVSAVRDAARRHSVTVIAPASLPDAYVWAEVLFCGASGTCVEAATIGIPGFVMALAENQEPIAVEASRRGMFLSLGRAGDLADAALIRSLEAMLADDPQRRHMVDTQRATIDGVGAIRAARGIVALMGQGR